MKIYWIKTDIDGSGRRWHLVRQLPIEESWDEESGHMIEFIGQDYKDFENNHLQNYRQDLVMPFDSPKGCDAETMRSIAVNEMWFGMVECRSCGHTWAAASPWNVEGYECPKCRIMSASRVLSKGDEIVERIITALVDIGGLSASGVVQWLETELNMALGAVLASGIRDDALRSLRDLMPICDKCGGRGGDCDAGLDGKTVSWVCNECGGIGRKYEKMNF